MEAGVGVNSPEFLQNKIERLKKALDEANVLMDRQVTERDEARRQLDDAKREADELRRELDELRASGAAAPAPEGAEQPAPGGDPAIEQELRDRIAGLEAEREQSQSAGSEAEQQLRDRISQLEAERTQSQSAGPEAEQQLRERADYLQQQLDDARRDLQAAQGDLDNARLDVDSARAAADSARSAADSARADADSARADAETARADAETARRESQQAAAAPPAAPAAPAPARRPISDQGLPATGPFVSQEVIRDALDNDNFVLFCQPVFSLQAERITQYELLLRLRDEDGRMVRPFSFLEPADRFGLMGEIDRWTVQHALDLLERDMTGELRLEVNIAAQSLADFELTALIEQHIAMTDLDPGRLILEVSENVAAAHLEDAQRLAKRLRGLGCGFALDDFGSTFASFRHLRDLPLSFLKIDGDLVVTVTESRTGQLTIKSLVELARGLGAETIAEYVSDDQTLEFLRDSGVGYAQGYRIGRPRPIDDVLNMHATHEHQPQPPVRVERPALGGGDEAVQDGQPESQPENAGQDEG
jgi:EAL domain-containing protein (putative c-di-GMP-specific phosphodiesterase class I)